VDQFNNQFAVALLPGDHTLQKKDHALGRKFGQAARVGPGILFESFTGPGKFFVKIPSVSNYCQIKQGKIG
jgi:hypothetical protein